MTLDRGNSVGFAVPPLLLFVSHIRRSPAWVAPVAVVLASAVRPQFALIAVALIAMRRYRAFLAAAAGVMLSTALGFALWPGSSSQHAASWLQNAFSYQGYIDLQNGQIANLSFAHSVVRIASQVSESPAGLSSGAESLITFVARNPSIPGLILVTLSVGVFALCGPRTDPAIVVTISLALPALVPSVSFGYYAVFVLVLAALALAPQGFDRLSGQATPSVGFRRALVVAIAFSLYPLAVASSADQNAVGVQYVGTVWSSIVLYGLFVTTKTALVAQIRRVSPIDC
jgi:hypothetical protein